MITHPIHPKIAPMPVEKNSQPWTVFKNWFDCAHQTSLEDPNAFVLSTVLLKTTTPAHSTAPQLEITSRVVLCKEVRENALIFYTNYNSEKALHLLSNPHCAVNFFWEPLYRQVRMQGHCVKSDRQSALNYWKTRPRPRQLSQWVSQQSSPLDNYEQFEAQIAQADAQFKDKEIPCPENWGGFTFLPQKMELWVGSHSRSHQRYVFKFNSENKAWCFINLLYP